MRDPVTIIDESGTTPRSVVDHWITQFRLANAFLIPWLEQHGVSMKGAAVAEIGCAEAGVLLACVEHGASYALGTDIMGPLLEQYSDRFARMLGHQVVFTQHDVIEDDLPPEWQQRFDVVLLRDVIEHLDDTRAALRNIKRLLKPGGVMIATFPPYTSPYGGHQQLLGTLAGKLPFTHLLPRSLFNMVVNTSHNVNKMEVERLAEIRLSADAVRNAATAEGYRVEDERFFLLRPVFRYKYNAPIPVVEVTKLGSWPFVRRVAMEAAFLLRVE
jgi:2-polyprenyl-3-methyl-5-hydroxy-6-metoxy-1,4-benzoquinol methylase